VKVVQHNLRNDSSQYLPASDESAMGTDSQAF